MKTISATNLRVQLRDLLADLDSGPVSITKHGKVVAVLSAPVAAPAEAETASEGEDTPEAPDASQSPQAPELRYPHSVPPGVNAPPGLAYENASPDQRDFYGMEAEDKEEAADPASRWGTEEIDDPLDGLDAEFEAYLSENMPMDRPDYYTEDEVFLR